MGWNSLHSSMFCTMSAIVHFVCSINGIQYHASIFLSSTNFPFVLNFRYSINVTAQNHISSISSAPLHLNLVQKVANLTSIFSQGPNLVNHPITYRALYWFGTNLTFQWDFGDGSSPLITTASSAQHTYKEYDT